jgi:hypothetical protein
MVGGEGNAPGRQSGATVRGDEDVVSQAPIGRAKSLVDSWNDLMAHIDEQSAALRA